MFIYINISLLENNNKQYKINDSFTYYNDNKVLDINDAPWP